MRQPKRLRPSAARLFRFVVMVALLLMPPALSCGVVAGAEKDVQQGSTPVKMEADVSGILEKPAPESVSDLRAIENQLKTIVEKITRTTVGVRIGRAQGSGVIVSKKGYVLTAAHVTTSPGRSAVVTLSDGRRVEATTLGLNRSLDAAILKITENGDWPHAEMGNMKNVKIGNWCVATGHPGGFSSDRTAVVRLGRVIRIQNSYIHTDCTLVGGDSGGPLFDMEGRVIGINSRIGVPTNWNFHIPVAAYQQGWDRLVASEVWGRFPGSPKTVLGVVGRDHEKGAEVREVTPGDPAEQAGIQPGDIITAFDGKRVRDFDVLAAFVRNKHAGDKVKVEILRDGREITISVTLVNEDS